MQNEQQNTTQNVFVDNSLQFVSTPLSKEIREAILKKDFNSLSLETKELLRDIAFDLFVRNRVEKQYEIGNYIFTLKSLSTKEILNMRYKLSKLDIQNKENDFYEIILLAVIYYISKIEIKKEENIEPIPIFISKDNTNIDEKIKELSEFLLNLPAEVYQILVSYVNEFADILNAVQIFYLELINFFRTTQNTSRG